MIDAYIHHAGIGTPGSPLAFLFHGTGFHEAEGGKTDPGHGANAEDDLLNILGSF